MSDPKGPVYLVGAREVMEEGIEPYALNQDYWNPVEPAALPPKGVESICSALAFAKEPLLITGSAGRNHAAVIELMALAKVVPALRVLDTGGSDMCFPASHPAWLGLRYGADDSIKTADVIIVVECDTPWIPTLCHPQETARIFHIDIDPLKQLMPVFYINAIARYRADSFTALTQLNEHLYNSTDLKAELDKQSSTARQEAYDTRLSKIRELAAPGADGTYGPSYLTSRLRAACPQDTIWVIEAVTCTAFVADQIQATLPGSWINCGGGGLGWSGGAALGIKLAADNRARQQQQESANEGGTNDAQQQQHPAHNSTPFVCQIVGDGTFLFSVPSSVYWISQRYNLPILTIILNNRGWNAPKRSALLVHPDGGASKATNEELNISFAPSPDYAGIAKASAGGKLWAGRASGVEELEEALGAAVESVKRGVGAVVDAHLEGPQGKFAGGVEGSSG